MSITRCIILYIGKIVNTVVGIACSNVIVTLKIVQNFLSATGKNPKQRKIHKKMVGRISFMICKCTKNIGKTLVNVLVVFDKMNYFV